MSALVLDGRRLTPARVEGLRAFDAQGVARESNCTDVKRGYVYWQTRAWLEREGLIEAKPHPFYELTGAGRRLLETIKALP